MSERLRSLDGREGGIAYWHVVTKAQAVWCFLRGDRRMARQLWRWMANLPTPADIEQAKRDLARPSVQEDLRRLIESEGQ